MSPEDRAFLQELQYIRNRVLIEIELRERHDKVSNFKKLSVKDLQQAFEEVYLKIERLIDNAS